MDNIKLSDFDIEFADVVSKLASTSSDKVVKIEGNYEFCTVISYMLQHSKEYFHLYDSVLDGLIAHADPVLFFNSLESYLRREVPLYIVIDNILDKNEKNNRITMDLLRATNTSECVKVCKSNKNFDDRLRNIFFAGNQYAVSDNRCILVMDPPSTKPPVGYFSFNQPEIATRLYSILSDISELKLDSLYGV